MLLCFTFRAKPGRETEFQALLDNPEGGRRVARAMGATRNALFLRDGRMVRIFEFPEGAEPRSLAEIAKEDPAVMTFLKKLGAVTEPEFDPDRPETMDAFNQAATVPQLYDVRP